MIVYTDSDWAGDKVTRKSTSCAVLKLGTMTLTLICRGQAVRAQSSAEAEVFAGVMGIKEAIHVQQLLGWMGEPVRIRLRMDAAAARSVLCRQGVGKIRHLEVKVLWAQDQTKNGRVLVEKVEGTLNTADIGTKPLEEKTLVRHRGSWGLMTLPEELRTAATATVQSGWFKRGSKGQMLAMMLAAVPLAATAEEHGLCLSTTSLQQPAAGGGGGWPMVLAVFLGAMLIGIYLG